MLNDDANDIERVRGHHAKTVPKDAGGRAQQPLPFARYPSKLPSQSSKDAEPAFNPRRQGEQAYAEPLVRGHA